MILKFINSSRSVYPDNGGKIFSQDHLLVGELVQLFQSSFLPIFKA